MDKPEVDLCTISSWQEFKTQASSLRGWAFRGQSDATWPLNSTLSRYLSDHKVHERAWPIMEARILRIFKRKAHLFASDLPEDSDSFEWLALMQHHGSPTRLIDFTWSPYVAAFFALEQATRDAAIWSVFPPQLAGADKYRSIRVSQRDEANELGPWIPGNFEKHFLVSDKQFALIGEPRRMNQRLVSQSGTFLTPSSIKLPAERILPPTAVKKLVIRTDAVRRDAMEDLYSMNISYATLFPGLDGMARSLAYELEYHWAFNPITMETFGDFHFD